MPNVLLTGFEAFGAEQINHSWQTVQQLNGWQPDNEITVCARQLPCVFDDSLQQLQQLITELKPVLIIATGQATGRSHISLEKVAINLNDARIADNRQQRPIDTRIIHNGPAAYFSNLPLKALRLQLTSQGIPTELSYTAGTFVCNHVFYGLMHLIQSQPELRGGFIHIPLSPAQAAHQPGIASMSSELVVDALKTIITTSLQQQEDLLIAGGTIY